MQCKVWMRKALVHLYIWSVFQYARGSPATNQMTRVTSSLAKHAQQAAVRRPPYSQETRARQPTQARRLNDTRRHGNARDIQFNDAMRRQSIHALYTRYPIVARAWPLGRVRRASKGILHTNPCCEINQNEWKRKQL